MRTRTTRRTTLTICVITLLLAALTLGATSRASDSGTTQGVTKDEIKVGIPLVDFNAIKDFVDYTFGDTEAISKVFVDYINKNGGIDGRNIVPVYKKYPPIPGGKPDPLSLCTVMGRRRQGLRGARRVHRLHRPGPEVPQPRSTTSSTSATSSTSRSSTRHPAG